MMKGGTDMAFFFSKEAKEQREQRRELERQQEELRKKEAEEERQKQEEAKRAYCTWFTKETKEFVENIKAQGFTPTWGFEVEPNLNHQMGEGGTKHDKIFVFDIPEIRGLVFDENSKRMLYFTCPSGYYDKYLESGTKLDFKYVFIPFSDIIATNVEVNSQTTFSTATSRDNVVGRSLVGGILGGDAGAIIGAATAKSTSVTKAESLPWKIVFTIETLCENHKMIRFEFNKNYAVAGPVGSKESMVDTMYSVFSDLPELAWFWEREQNRKCGTVTDYYYDRAYTTPEHDPNNSVEVNNLFDYICKVEHLEFILKRVNRYVRKVENIIKQCDDEKTSKSSNLVGNISIADEILKFKNLLDMGIISQDEFEKKKRELLEL